MKEGRLGYNSDNKRYGLLISDLWEHDGFHCGERLEVQIDGGVGADPHGDEPRGRLVSCRYSLCG